MTDIKSVFSPSPSAIYLAAYYDDYVCVGVWSTDGIEISDEDAIAFDGTNQPTSKKLSLVDERLAWIDVHAPTQTHEQLIAAPDVTWPEKPVA